MVRLKHVFLLITILSMCSCKCKMDNATTEKTNSDNSNMENTELLTNGYSVIGKGNLYGSGEEGINASNLVVANKNDWDKLIAQLDSVNKVSTGFKDKTVDFSEYTIIAVFDDVKSSGGHILDLDVVTNTENTVINITKKAPSGVSTSVMTQPYCIIKISKSNLPIVFK